MSVLDDLQRAFALIRQLQGALGGNRVISGVVSSAGVVVAGDDLGSIRNSTGDYTISFAPAFDGLPSIQITPESGNDRRAMLFNVTGSTARVLIRDTSGATADSQFHVTAIG